MLEFKMSPSQVDQRQPPIHFYLDEDNPVHVHVEGKPSAKAVSVTTKTRQGTQQLNYKPKRKNMTNTSKHGASAMDSLLLESVLTEMKRFNATTKTGPANSSLPAVNINSATSAGHNMTSTTEGQLLARLVDFEQESVAVSRAIDQVCELIRTASDPGKRQSRNLSNKDLVILKNTCTSLHEQLEALDVNNRVLRSLLRQREEEERDKIRLQQHNDSLLIRYAELETMNKRFQAEILDKEKHLRQLQAFADAQRDENLAIQSSHDVAESTRMHLQKQLRVKEADCNRMAVQIRQLETQMAQDRIDSEHILELLQETRDKNDSDKNALKRAARAQKERANRLAEEVDRLHSLLVDKEPILEQLVKEEEDRLKCEGDQIIEKIVDTNEEAPVNSTSKEHISSDQVKVSVSNEERRSYECLINQHQQECQRAEQRNLNYEQRLRNMEERNKSLVSQLSEASSMVESCKHEMKDIESSQQTTECRWRETEARLEEVRRERDALQVQHEKTLADLRRQRETIGESPTERKLRQRVRVLEEEQRNLKEKLEHFELNKIAMEKFYVSRMSDLKSRLDINISKDKSMRMYIQQIKETYDKCFGDVKD